MEFNKRSLTPQEAEIILGMTERGLDRIESSTAKEWLNRTPKSVSKILRSLQSKGWLEGLGAGDYVLIPPERGPEVLGDSNPLALAWASVQPSYVGWWNAAAFHHLTTQHPVEITIATTKPHRRRVISGEDVRYIHLMQYKFFGSMTAKLYGRSFEVSDREKTVIDCVDRPSLCGGHSEVCRIVSRAADDLDWDKLLVYCRRFESTSLIQRIGFFLELVASPPEDLIENLQSMIGPNDRSALGLPVRNDPDAIGFVRRWKLHVPFSRAKLLAEVPSVSR
jgi:predicted transcriptional regulator of viral defense system